MRREPQQTAALRAGLEDKMKVPVLEIAHATVDEPR